MKKRSGLQDDFSYLVIYMNIQHNIKQKL